MQNKLRNVQEKKHTKLVGETGFEPIIYSINYCSAIKLLSHKGIYFHKQIPYKNLKPKVTMKTNEYINLYL